MTTGRIDRKTLGPEDRKRVAELICIDLSSSVCSWRR